MPIYDYECEACGPFTAMRPMAQFRDPCTCPECGAAAPRTILNAPAVAGANQGGHIAFAATGPNGPPTPGCGCASSRLRLLRAPLAAAGRPVRRRTGIHVARAGPT